MGPPAVLSPRVRSMASFAYRILPRAEPWEAMEPGEAALLVRYLEHLQSLRQDGSVRLVGRERNGDYAFMLVVDAGDEAHAKTLAQGDPAVREGLIRIARHPSLVVLDDVKADPNAGA